MIRYTLDKNNRGAEVSRHLYGLFFEDINQAADGGLNAEMVVNNSFEFEYLSYDAHNCTVPVQLRSMKDKFWDISGAGPHYISTDGGIGRVEERILAEQFLASLSPQERALARLLLDSRPLEEISASLHLPVARLTAMAGEIGRKRQRFCADP